MATKHVHEDRKALVLRIRKITGQLNAIERMLDEDRECPDILTQVVSARKGLKSFAEKLINEHTHHCIQNAGKGRGQAELEKLLEVLARYVE